MNQSRDLRAVTVVGYKGFSTPTRIDLAPITLVFGENSAGKSSLIRLLVSIASAIFQHSKYPLLPVDPNGAPLGFKDLFTDGAAQIALDLEFGDSSTEQHTASYAISYFPESNTASVVDFRLFSGNATWILQQKLDELNGETYNVRQANGADLGCVQLRFQGLAPSIEPSEQTEGILGLSAAVQLTYASLHAFASTVTWIGPLRAVPQRNIRLTPYPSRISCSGIEAAQLVHPSNPGGEEVRSFVSDWYKLATDRLLLVPTAVVNSRDVFDLVLAPTNAPQNGVPISEHGAGMAQVFPIVASCGLAHTIGHGQTLVLENPELHLHDAIHEHLAHLFFHTIEERPSIRLIAETHSENLLLACQLAIVSGTANRDVIAVNWVQKTAEGGSTSRKFEFDDNGSLGSLWSKTIFSYTSDLARRIIKVRLGTGVKRD